MATKRPYSDVHPSRREQVPHASRKRQKPDNLGSKSYKKAHPVNELKTRLRNLTRLLARDDDNLPANIRVSKERELQTVQHELQETQAAERKSKMIARYHKIRFFDRQKATKRLKKAQKLLDALGDDGNVDKIKQRQAEVDEAQVDINYAMYYPLDKPYNSLFPKDESVDEAPDDSMSESVHKISGKDKQFRGDPEIRLLVKQCMDSGKLNDLRNGKITGSEASTGATTTDSRPSKSPATGKTKSVKQSKHHKRAKPVVEDDSDEESDGGFFE